MPHAKQKHDLSRNIVKGIFAIFFWIGCFSFVWWYQHGGFWTYWKYAFLFGIFLSILTAISQRARAFIRRHVLSVLEGIFSIYEEKMEWVAYFLLAMIYVGIIYFLLVAPYGILCHLGMKSCGKW
jgi:hypothetical protein